jgi:chromosome segregation ATPase
MPIPFLLAAPAAASSSITTLTYAAVATKVGVGWLSWFFSGKNESSITLEHQQSLDTQHRLVLARIDDATIVVEDVGHAVNSVAAGVVALREEVADSVQSVHEAAEHISTTSHNLQLASQAAFDSSNVLSSLEPRLQELFQRMQEENARTEAKLDQLHRLLSKKDEEMAQAYLDLKQVVDEQTGVISTLGDAVQGLQAQNEEQATVITAQKARIMDVTKEATRAMEHCRFFKEKAAEAMQLVKAQQAHLPSNTPQ